MSKLWQSFTQGAADPERIARSALKSPARVVELIEGLRADTARVKYGCAKVLRLIAERQPERLYPYFDDFARLLDSDNKILQWEGAFLLSHLARVDVDHRLDRLLDKYLAPITGRVMITAANVIGGAARIAVAKPEWAERIATEILKVSRARHQTVECRHVAIGHALGAFELMFDSLEDQERVLRFVRQQLGSPRSATRKKAERFLKRRGFLTRPVA